MAEIKITADTSQAERDIKRLSKAIDQLDEFSAGAAKGLAAITAAAGAMTFAILKTLDSAGELVDASKAIGVSAANLQQLQSAAAMAGVGADQLNASLIRLSGNLGSALQKGSGPAIDALKSLNIPLNEIARMRPDEQFKRIATEINKITNPAERNAKAIELFGKQGPRLLDVANNLDRIAQSLTDADFVALDEAGDALDLLKAEFDVGLKKAVAEIAPLIIAIVNKIREAVKEAGGFEAIWQKIKDAVRLALNIAIFTAAIAGIAKLVSLGLALRVAILQAGVAMGLFNAIVRKNPLMLAVGAALLLAKVLGLDIVGAMEEYLGLNDEVNKVNEELAKKTEEVKANNEASVDAMKGYNEEQQKALKALEKSLAALEISRDAAIDKLKYTEIEGEVQKRITEEALKLAEVGLTLSDQQAARIRGAIEEEAVAKRLYDQRKAIEDLTQEQAVRGGANSELLKMQKQMEEATKTRILAESNANNEILSMAIQQESQLKALYKDRVISLAQGASERGKIEQDYYLKVNQLEQLQQELRKVGADNELALVQQLEDEKYRIKEEYSKKLEQLELDRITKTLMAERSGIAQSLSDADQAALQKMGAEERQKAIVDERIKFEKKSDLEKTQWAIDNAQQVFAALGQQNKKAFEASKALAVASAIMNTYQAASKALATYPFPFGLIAAAGAVAAGFAQVSAIRSQQYSGRALGGPVMGGQTYLVGESGPELFTPQGTGSITRNGDLQGGGAVSVNFTIVANDTQGFDALLSSRKGVIQQIISDAMLERGQRSAM